MAERLRTGADASWTLRSLYTYLPEGVTPGGPDGPSR